MAGRGGSPEAAPEGLGTSGAEARKEPPKSAPGPWKSEPSPTPEEGRREGRRKPAARPTTATSHPCRLTVGRTWVRNTQAGDGSDVAKRSMLAGHRCRSSDTA